jgi:hypothetical protein
MDKLNSILKSLENILFRILKILKISLYHFFGSSPSPELPGGHLIIIHPKYVNVYDK